MIKNDEKALFRDVAEFLKVFFYCKVKNIWRKREKQSVNILQIREKPDIYIL